MQSLVRAACAMGILALTVPGQTTEEGWTHVAHAHVASGHSLATSPLGVPIHAALLENADIQKLRAGFQLATRAPLERALQTLAGGPIDIDVYLAQVPKSRLRGARKQSTHIVLRSHTAKRDEARSLVRSSITLIDHESEVTRHDYRGVECSTIDNVLAIAHVDDTLLVASHENLLADAIDDLLDGDTATPVASEPGVHVEIMRPPEAVASDPALDDEPLGNLLFAGLVEAAMDMQTLEAHLTWTDDDVLLDAGLVTDDELSVTPYTPGHATAVAIPTSPDTLGVLFARRDVAEWWRRRETLMPPAVQKGLARFDSDMTTLFSGQDLAEDIFGKLADAWALVIDRQDFDDADNIPDVRLPGFCLVTQIGEGHEASLSRTMRVAFQSVLGFVNADRAESGDAPFLMDVDVHDGIPVYAAHLVPDVGRAGVAAGSLEFNFSPSMAIVDRWMLFGSSAEQVKRLVSSIVTEETTAIASNTFFDVDVSRALHLAEENRSALIAQTVLEKGLGVAAAAQEVDELFDLASLLDAFRLDIAPSDEGVTLQIAIDTADAP